MAIDYKARLSRMTAATSKPLLDDATLTDLLNQFRARDSAGNRPLPIWSASSPYETAGLLVIPSLTNGHVYKVTTAGISGTTEPTWPTGATATVTDGTVVWTENGVYQWRPTYRLRAAAAEGWRQKAGMAAPNFDVNPSQGMVISRSQIYAHCLTMVDYYQKGLLGSVRFGSDEGEQRELLGGREVGLLGEFSDDDDDGDFDMNWLPRAN